MKYNSQSIRKKFFSFHTLFSFIIVVVIFYILVFNLNSKEVLSALKSIRLHYYIIAFFLFYLAVFLRNLRWQLLLKNIGHKLAYFRLFKVLMASYFANCIIPAKLGDFVRGYLLNKKYKLSFFETIGTVFTERLVDIVYLIILLTSSGFILFKSKLNKYIIMALIIGYFVIIVCIMFIIFLRMKIKIKKYLPKKITIYLISLEKGIINSIHSRNLPVILLYSLLIWFFETTSLYFIFLSLGLDLSYYLAIFIALAASLLTAIPLTPAGLGAVDFAIVAVLIMFGIEKNIGVTIALLQRFINYISILIIGGFISLFDK